MKEKLLVLQQVEVQGKVQREQYIVEAEMMNLVINHGKQSR
jgi:hypothetical protein